MIHFALLYLLQKITLLEKKQQNACTEYFLYISLHRFRDKTRTRSLMDRALGYGPRGCGFDSRRVHLKQSRKATKIRQTPTNQRFDGVFSFPTATVFCTQND